MRLWWALGSHREYNMTEEVSFHDNRIHSISFVDENFETSLILDIDHILEWVPSGDACQFRITPAKLKYNNVSDLELKLSKPGFTINSYLETIIDVNTEEIAKDRIEFTISLLDGNSIKFVASSFSLEILGIPKLKPEQYLTVLERENA